MNERLTLSDAHLAGALLAVDPAGLGGILLRERPGPWRDRWLAELRRLLPERRFRPLPLHAGEDRLFGGLDIAATLASGRPVRDPGLVAESRGGILVVAGLERMAAPVAARLAAAMDEPGADLALIAFDESVEEDEAPPAALAERLGLVASLDGDATTADGTLVDAVVEARRRLGEVELAAETLEALCATALALGIASLRMPILAARAAVAAAALRGAGATGVSDAAAAARLVLAPRARQLPAAPVPKPTEAAPSKPDEGSTAGDPGDAALADDPEALVLAAARAAIPPGLLRQLEGDLKRATGKGEGGRPGAARGGSPRGRPTGSVAGLPGRGRRLDVVATLRAAAPWQTIRGRPAADGIGTRLAFRRDDFRLHRYEPRRPAVTIFVVDGSGSLAASRLAEAKGAVELLLADCYVRRDEVALMSFRGRTADLLLPPTRSLARARRALAALPGSGGTPLAAAIDAAADLAANVRRRGRSPVVVFLTDGKANVARDGRAGRAEAEADTRLAARTAAATGTPMLVIDAAPRPQASAKSLAEALGGRYLPLPRADARTLSRAVSGAGGQTSR